MIDVEKSLFDLDKIVYCGEGNATIVVANPSLGWIIRIRKSDEKRPRPSKMLSNLAELSTDPRIPRYFGSRFTRQMLLIDTDPAFLLKLEKKIARFRPDYRKCKSIDVSERYVIVAPDAARTPPNLTSYTYGSTISVEIKPKFGAFILWPATGVTNVVRTHASLFCLRQNHTGKLSRWKTPSEYCPCDLFSGNQARMLRSLKALLQIPQINLRIHLDSRIVFSHEVDRLDKALAKFFWDPHEHEQLMIEKHDSVSVNGHTACVIKENGHSGCGSDCVFFNNNRRRLLEGLLLDALLLELDPAANSLARYSQNLADRAAFSLDCCMHHSHPTDHHGVLNGSAHYSVSDAAVSQVSGFNDEPLPPEGSILGRVLATQLLSRLDICFITSHYERVHQYLSDHQLTWEYYTRLSDEERSRILSDSPDMKESFDIVERYLISLVARDCSIMLTFQRAKPHCPSWVPTVGGDKCKCLPRMVVNASVIDLDPKHLDKIRDRLRVEQSIVYQTLQHRPNFFQLLHRRS